MKLCAIFNAWSDAPELLVKSIQNLLPVCDGIIVVWSNESNWGQFKEFHEPISHKNVSYIHVEPTKGHDPSYNETLKRNFGIEQAKKEGYTHFILCDSDEFYIQSDILKDKEYIEKNDLNGLVHPCIVLFKKPTLYCEDHTLVCGIQKLTPSVSVGYFRNYPFAYDEEGNAHIDPTRRPSHKNGIEMSPTLCYHASWIRTNFDLKIENSTARHNLKKSSIYKDLQNAKEGYWCEFYRTHLKKIDNIFGL